MPSACSSSASDFISMITPALEAQYAAWYGCARRPAIEAIVTMLPLLARRCGSAAWLISIGPVRLTPEVPLPGGDVEVLEPPELVDAGHVDQDVEPAELLDGGGDRRCRPTPGR